MKPTYQKNMARLAAMINTELRAMIGSLKHGIANVHHVRIEYSDALTNGDLSRLELINAVDGWHPSIEGHKVLAQAAFSALHPSLVFLGITTRRPEKRRLLVGNYPAH